MHTEDSACLCASQALLSQVGERAKYEEGRIRNGLLTDLAEADFPPPQGGEVHGENGAGLRESALFS